MQPRTFGPLYERVIPLKQEGMARSSKVDIGQGENSGKMGMGIFAQDKLSHNFHVLL